MNICCFMCNTRTSIALRNATSIFGDHNKLASGRKLHEVLSEIVNKSLKEDAVHSKILCKKCYKACSEYDHTQVSLQSMKIDLLNQFKMSLQNSNLNYDAYEKDVKSKVPVKTYAEKKTISNIVLPASKLQPLTPELLLKVGKLAAVSKANLLMDKNKQRSIMTISNTKLSQVTKPTDVLATLDNSLVTSSMSDDGMKTISLRSLTNDFLTSDEANGGNEDSQTEVQDDDEAMEIDEDCALSVVPVTSANGDLVLEVQGVKRPAPKSTADQADCAVPSSASPASRSPAADNFILGKLQILNDGEEQAEEHTIVLDGDDGSILRMVSGQRLVYDGNQLSLVMPANQPDGADNDDQHNQVEQLDVFVEPEDFNEEPQIELQVSGDEETANAIIAAAQELGGAFIKVESGEMFRVQSVQSKKQDENDNSQALQMIERVDGKFNCLLCKNSLKNGWSAARGEAEWMMRHLRGQHGARLYLCRLCGAAHRRRADYSAHIAQHTTKGGDGAAARPERSKSHTCWLCGKTFASKYTLHAHHKTHADRPRPFKCKQCSKSFLTQQNLNQHEKTHSGVKDFVCNICQKAFSTQHNLEVHGVVHSGARPYACATCAKAFARRAELRDHMRTHTGERPYSCSICGATFTQRSNLHSHHRATHLGEKRHQCTICPKRFKRKRLLDYHIKASHTGERPLKCDVCSATFVYPEHFKKHIRIHSGERPYICEICGKSFTSRDNRNTHRFVHSDKKPYECLSCGAGYMRKHLLYAHMDAAGHFAESIVVNQPRVTKVSTNLFESTDELRLDSAEGKSIVSKPLVQRNDPLFIQALTTDRTEVTLLDAVDSEQFEESQLIANDETGETVRLIQIKLPGGNDGWVAVNN